MLKGIVEGIFGTIIALSLIWLAVTVTRKNDIKICKSVAKSFKVGFRYNIFQGCIIKVDKDINMKLSDIVIRGVPKK